MKKIGLVIMVLLLSMGCSANTVEDISVADMKEEIKQIEGFGMVADVGLSFLNESLEANEEELSEYAYFEGIRVSSARIAIFEVKEEELREKYIGIANEIRASVFRSFQDYLLDQLQFVKNSRVEQRGQYIILVVHEKADEIWKIIDTYIPNNAAEDVTDSE